MRLIHTTSLEIREFLREDAIPRFVILSHTWEDEECTLQQMQDLNNPLLLVRKGYKKIQQCCTEALKDGYNWAWIDTCVHHDGIRYPLS
jgi:hypothetical protein